MAYTGVNQRATSGYVTDGSGYTYSLGAAYPETRGGQTFGWSSSVTSSSRDRSTSYGPIQAGIVFKSNSGGSTIDFKLDLPSAGQYRIRICAGDFSSAQDNKIIIKDGATTLATISASTAAGDFMDATGAVHTAANYAANNTFITHTFAGTQLVLTIGGAADTAKSTVLCSVSYEAVADTTAPVLTSPVGTQTGSTTATIGATTDEGNGTMYGVATVSGAAPSVAQIQAGQDNSGAAAAYASSQAIATTGAKTFSATGLAASTAYYAHIQHTDAATNNSTVVTSAQFTTAAGTVAAQGANVARRNLSGINSFGLRR